MEHCFGIKLEDLFHWKKLVAVLHRPKDASILAFTRICFGFLMLLDIPQERGMNRADMLFSDEMRDICRFPMFSFLHTLDEDYMALLYTVLVFCAIGIMLGLFYRISCFFFTLMYWYFFLLDKSTWNNHSYLYGLIGILFLFSDAHRYASIDGLFRRKLRDSHVPLWNYTLLRFQIFLVYFYAGLKKTDQDWLMGYSMHKLTRHWIFDPMRPFMSERLMDLVVVHYGGFLLDISAGFLLFFDRTRVIGFVLCGSFHAMNSQLFNIGMFPYAMLSTMFVFCPTDSFKNFQKKLSLSGKTQATAVPQTNNNCIYSETKDYSWKQSISTILTLVYIAEQLFLPYSHFITKGYNGWTEGPYGYSWDMMVHSFSDQHVKITYVDKFGEEGYLKPGSFLLSTKSRWSSHPDMTIQYARCLKKRLIDMGIEEPAIYFDIWKSMNGRFQQRVVDPNVDMASYDWSPFKDNAFSLPVLVDLSGWREKLLLIKEDLKNQTFDVVFVADFPGLSLENFVQSDFDNTSIEVMQGSVSVAMPTLERNVSLYVGDQIKIPAGAFHTVTTTSTTPSCYFYIYQNTTERVMREKIKSYRRAQAGDDVERQGDLEDPVIMEYVQYLEAKENSTGRSAPEKLLHFLSRKYATFRRSFLISFYSIRNLVFGRPDEEQLKRERSFMDVHGVKRFT